MRRFPSRNPAVCRGARRTRLRLKDSIKAARCMPFPHPRTGESIHARTAISGQTPYDRCYPLPIAQPPSTNKQLQRRVGKCLWTQNLFHTRLYLFTWHPEPVTQGQNNIHDSKVPNHKHPRLEKGHSSPLCQSQGRGASAGIPVKKLR
jgi:hypothetical protein